MIDAILAKIFGTKNEREIKATRPMIAAINDLELAMQAFPTPNWPPRLPSSRSVSPTAPRWTIFSSKSSPSGARSVGALSTCGTMRHFDVQLIGGIILHRGKISEMKTTLN